MYSVNKELIIRSSSEAVDFALLKDGKLLNYTRKKKKATFKLVIFLLPKSENLLLD